MFQFICHVLTILKQFVREKTRKKKLEVKEIAICKGNFLTKNRSEGDCSEPAVQPLNWMNRPVQHRFDAYPVYRREPDKKKQFWTGKKPLLWEKQFFEKIKIKVSIL